MSAQQEKLKGVFIGSDHDGAAKSRVIGLIVAILILVSALAVGGWYLFAKKSTLSDSQQQAITSVDSQYQGFANTDKTMYNRGRLNQAVVLANSKQCDQARAVYDNVAQTDTDTSELARYKTRIDDLCSGKSAAAAQE